MTLISKYVYIDKLDDIVNKYNNTYHSTIKIKYLLKIAVENKIPSVSNLNKKN